MMRCLALAATLLHAVQAQALAPARDVPPREWLTIAEAGVCMWRAPSGYWLNLYAPHDIQVHHAADVRRRLAECDGRR